MLTEDSADPGRVRIQAEGLHPNYQQLLSRRDSAVLFTKLLQDSFIQDRRFHEPTPKCKLSICTIIPSIKIVHHTRPTPLRRSLTPFIR